MSEVRERRHVAYDDVEQLREVVVGRRVTDVVRCSGWERAMSLYNLQVAEWEAGGREGAEPFEPHPGAYDVDVVEYHFDDGTVLRAAASDEGWGIVFEVDDVLVWRR